MPALSLALAILLVATALRIAAASSGGLWLDEIWSVQLAEDLASPFEAFGIRQDNNHPLNTLLLWLLVDDSGPGDFLRLRTPAVIAGVAATAMAGFVGLARSSKEACATMLLVATSSLMVHYSSEARGYAFAMLFALTSLLALGQRRAQHSGRWCLVFHVSILLGMLSHFSFAQAFGAMLCWWAFGERNSKARDALREFTTWLLLPLLFTFVLYWLHARTLPVAGGPDPQLARLLARTGALAIGSPDSGSLRWLGGGTALVLALGGIGWLARRGEERWVLYASGIFLLPALTLLLHRPEFLAPRYFLMSTLLFLLLMGEGIGELLRSRESIRVLAGLVLVCFVAGNALEIRELLRNGRGHYWTALIFMANRTRGPAITVGTDHDVRVGVVMGYHARVLPDGKRLAYYRQRDWPDSGPEWFVQHRHGRIHPLEKAVVGRKGNHYRLERVFPTGPLSGSHWLIYHNEAHIPDREAE